jgi:glycosyltransferase involved in cell wall biosynthesis
VIQFNRSPRIAFIDLTFNWPPVGGCWLDTHHLIKGLQQRGADVTLFVPDFQTYYPRGTIQSPLPYPVVLIPFNRYTFHFKNVIERFKTRVKSFKPDLIYIHDGYQMKNHLLTAFGPERCFLRFYAYEMLCINLHYYRYHEKRICDQGFFTNPSECHRCWFRRMPMLGRAAQIALGWKESHPTLHFSQEYLGSLAFTEAYREQLFKNFRALKGAVVYNDFMRDQLSRYITNIHVIPSGVDLNLYTPAHPVRSNDEPVKIFLPGRANDPLKGLSVLLAAAEQLEKEGLSGFEVHYTAAMNCKVEKPWLINRGWVTQDQLPSLYHEMDIVAVPSTWIEPFGITALEGMAAGLPVVASRIGGLAQTVVDGETGYHFEAGNAQDLARVLKLLLTDESLRQQMGQKGRERIAKVYNWDTILDTHYIPLLSDALGISQAAPFDEPVPSPEPDLAEAEDQDE